MMSLVELTLSEEIERKRHLYKRASALAVGTISFNLIAGCLSVSFGIQDRTLALTGFGLYSIVEVVVGIGLWRGVTRIRHNIVVPGSFEEVILKTAGWAFFVLSGGLALVSLVSVFIVTRPETTFWGVVIALICIPVGWNVADLKTKMGKNFKCGALLADANRAATLMQLSTALFISSISFEATRAALLDSLGMAATAVLAFREGKKTFERIKHDEAASPNETAAGSLASANVEFKNTRAA